MSTSLSLLDDDDVGGVGFGASDGDDVSVDVGFGARDGAASDDDDDDDEEDGGCGGVALQV